MLTHTVVVVETFELVTEIAAPCKVVFDLSRDIDFHLRSMGIQRASCRRRHIRPDRYGRIRHLESDTLRHSLSHDEDSA